MVPEQISSTKKNLLKGYNMLLYFAGTMIMWDPSNECIYDFWTSGIIKSLPVSSNNPKFLSAASHLRNSIEDKNSSHDSMKKDYTRLFSATGAQLAAPLESAYRNHTNLLGNRNNRDVRDFYRSYGWESKFSNSIPDDHIGVELLFLTLMIEKYLELDDMACHIEMANEINRYLKEHLESWIHGWNEDVQENSQTLSYKGISMLIAACIEDISSIVNEKKSSQPAA